LYFNPQSKIAAYNNAALALECGASVSADLTAIRKASEADASQLAALLSAAIDQANRLAATPISGASAAQTRAALLTARDQAQKAADELNVALGTLQTASARLQVFAIQVMRNATTKVVTGTQNMDAALAAIRAAAAPGAPAKAPAGAPTMAAAAVSLTPLIPPDEAGLTRFLQISAAKAQSYTKTINDAWSLLAGCTST
jgi:hypothetical protein